MRESRFVWTSNLPAQCGEDSIREALQCHGKIQTIRFMENGDVRGAVVAFMDVRSAAKALEFVNKIGPATLKLEYCESGGLRGGIQHISQTLPTNLNDKSGPQNLGILPDASRRSDVSAPGSLSSTSSRTEDHKNRSAERSVPERSRSSSVSSSYSEVSSVGGSTKRRKVGNHKSSEGVHLRQDRHRVYDDGIADDDSVTSSGGLRGIKICQLPLRSSDTSVRDGLFHEYKKHGKISSIFIEGQGPARYCIITYKKSEEAEKAIETSKDKIFFNTPICVSRHVGYDIEDPNVCPPEQPMDEYHQKATKTLFVGNLVPDAVTDADLQKHFEKFGEIIDIDIKSQANQTGLSYAFIQYRDIKSVVRALSFQETIKIKGRDVKLGFGKSQPTKCIWLDNLATSITENFLGKQFKRYGQVDDVILDRKVMQALVYFDSTESAQKAVAETKNRALAGRKVQIDYANAECQALFTENVPHGRTWTHSSYSTGNYDNYRENMYLTYINWNASYGKTMPPYSDDRNRRHFEELRPHEEFERDPYLARSDSFREARRGDRTSYVSSSLYPSAEYRSPTSVSGKRTRYYDDTQTPSGHRKSGERRSDPHLSGSRPRSESPFSTKSSQSREREPLGEHSSRSRSPRRTQRESVTVGRTHNTDEETEHPTTHPRDGDGRYHSRSRSHRSSSLADKERGSSGSRRSSRRRSGDTVEKESPTGRLSSPVRVSPTATSTIAPTINAISVNITSRTSQPKGEEPSAESISKLERERQSLLIELSKLDKGETDSESSACTDLVDKELSAAKRRVKHDLRDVFNYDHLSQEKETQGSPMVNNSQEDSMVGPPSSSLDKSHPNLLNGLVNVDSTSKSADENSPTARNSKLNTISAASTCDNNFLHVWETGDSDSEMNSSKTSISFIKRRLNRAKETACESACDTEVSKSLVGQVTSSTTENFAPGGRCYRTKSVTEDVFGASDEKATTRPNQLRLKIPDRDNGGSFVPTMQQFEETVQRHPHSLVKPLYTTGLADSATNPETSRLTLHIPTSIPASAPPCGNTTTTQASSASCHLLTPSPSNPFSVSQFPSSASPLCPPRDPRLASHLYQSLQQTQGGNSSLLSNTPASNSDNPCVSSSSVNSESASNKIPPDVKLEVVTEPQIKSSEKRDSDSTCSPISRQNCSAVEDDYDSGLSDVEHETVIKGEKSVDERIRQLDAKMVTTEKARPPVVDYSKFKIRKRAEISPLLSSISPALVGVISSSVSNIVSPVTTCNAPPECSKTDTSAFVKSMLSKPSTFVQETSRLLGTGEYVSNTGWQSVAPVQPLTIGIATGGSSGPSSLSSSGSLSYPHRGSMGLLNGITSSIPSQGSAIAVATAVSGNSLLRTNYKLESPVSSSIVSTTIVATPEAKFGDHPVKSILKKDSTSSLTSLSSPGLCNNNNNGSPFSDTFGTSFAQRTNRPLPIPIGPPIGIPKTFSNSFRPEVSPLTAQPRIPGRVDSNKISPTTAPVGTNLSALSKHVRPSPITMAPKTQPSPSIVSSKGNSGSSHKESKKSNPVGNASLNGPTKRKAVHPEDAKKSKISKLDNKPTLDDTLFGSILCAGKEKKHHKKIKTERVEDRGTKKGTSDDSNQSKIAPKELALNSTDRNSTELKKAKKHEHKHEKHKKKKEKELDNIHNSAEEDTYDNLFQKFNEEERKKTKKKREKESRNDGKSDFSLFDDKVKKERKKHQHDKNKKKVSNSGDQNHSPHNQLGSHCDTSKVFPDKEYKKKKESKKVSDSAGEENLKQTGSNSKTSSFYDDFFDPSPYESMYDKIKRRASKEADRKQTVPQVSSGSNKGSQKLQKKRRSKKQKSFLDTDSDLDSGSLHSTITNDTSKSVGRRSKGKSGKGRLGKRLTSNENASDHQISIKRSRLDSEKSEKVKKRSRKSEGRGKPPSKRDRFLKGENKKGKTWSTIESQSQKKKRVTVDSVFGDSSSDTSRACSPLGRFGGSMHEHSADETKTTPSTEPMENSENEYHRLKSTEDVDDWKSSFPSTPVHEEAELSSQTSLSKSPDKKYEDITISEDLPCLEKQSDEDLMEKSPRSIDDEPPDHLESIYDSPCDLKNSQDEQVIEEEIIYDNIELPVHDLDTKYDEQSRAVASILDSCGGAPKVEKDLGIPTLLEKSLSSLEIVTKPLPFVDESKHLTGVASSSLESGLLLGDMKPKLVSPPVISGVGMGVPSPFNFTGTPLTPTTAALSRLSLQGQSASVRALTCPSQTNSGVIVTSPAAARIDVGSKTRGEAETPDFTSYVQSVIERVKQEKVKETQHTRDKTLKRQKKYTTTSTAPSSNVSLLGPALPSVPSSQPQTNPVWSMGMPGLTSAVKMGPTDVKPIISPAVPSIPGVNICTPVCPPMINKVDPTGNNKTVPGVTHLPPAHPQSTSTAPISSSHLITPQMLSQVNPQVMAVANMGLHIPPIMPPGNLPTDVKDHRPTSPRVSTPVASEEGRSRRKMGMRIKRSGSISKNHERSPEKNDQLLALEKTINDVVRGGSMLDDGRRSETSTELGFEADVSNRSKDDSATIDPYEPNFDDSPPSQVHMNRELHHRNRPSSSAGPGPTIPGAASTNSDVSHTSTTGSATAPIDTVTQVIEDVCQGKFDMHQYLESWQNRVDDEHRLVSSPSTAETPVASRPNEQALSAMTLLALATFQQQQQLAHLPVLPTSVGFQPINLSSSLTSVTSGNGVQLGVVNSQPYPAVQAVEERGYPIERVPNPGLGQLTIRTGLNPFVLPPHETMSPRVGTPGVSCASTTPSSGITHANAMGGDTASPALISRPSSNPMAGRNSTASNVFSSKTPDQASPSSTGTPRPPLSSSACGSNTGSTAPGFLPPPFDSVNATPEQIQTINYYHHYIRQFGGAAALASLPVTQEALYGMPLTFPGHQSTTPLDFTTVRLLEGIYSGVVPTDGRASAAGSQSEGRPPSQQQLPSTAGQTSSELMPNNMVQVDWDLRQLLGPRYGMVWQGRLSLKNEEALVQMHYVHGNNDLIKECMNMAGHTMDQPLKIVQRMRLEAAQLEGVQRKMQQESDFCVCLALPSGANNMEFHRMSSVLRSSFIKYMQEKMAAGIINVYHHEFHQGLYVVHIFPPCEFSQTQLQLCAPELSERLNREEIPHLLVVITTV